MHQHIDRDREIIYCDNHIEVRPLGLREAAALYDAVHQSAAAISRWEGWCSLDYSQADAKLFVQQSIEQWNLRAAYDFNVIARASKEVIGSVAINQISQLNQMANLGYWVREGYTGRGIAALAARAAARFAFGRLGLTRLEIVAQASNLRSQRVAEKAGATMECLARNRLVFHGELRDATVFSLLPTDLELRSLP